VKLAGLGLVPGAVVHLQQKTPATVLRIGETTIAFDPAIASEIYVRRVEAGAESPPAPATQGPGRTPVTA
jgi:hypothetical protein